MQRQQQHVVPYNLPSVNEWKQFQLSCLPPRYGRRTYGRMYPHVPTNMGKSFATNFCYECK